MTSFKDFLNGSNNLGESSDSKSINEKQISDRQFDWMLDVKKFSDDIKKEITVVLADLSKSKDKYNKMSIYKKLEKLQDHFESLEYASNGLVKKIKVLRSYVKENESYSLQDLKTDLESFKKLF